MLVIDKNTLNLYFYYFCKVVEFRKRLSKKIACNDESFYELVWNYSFLVASASSEHYKNCPLASVPIEEISRDCAHWYFDCVEKQATTLIDAEYFQSQFEFIFNKYVLRVA